MQKLSLKSEDDLFAGIGYGKYSLPYLFSLVMPGYKKTDKLSLITKTTGSVISKILQKIKPGSVKSEAIVSPFGGDLLYKLAGCCHPIPGDDIVGFISRGRGVIVHKYDCKNIIGIDKSRLINVSWKEGAGRQNLSGGEFFETKIRIITDDKKGILGDIASLISAKGANISKAQVRTIKDGRAVHLFDIEVRDNKQADSIIDGIKSVKGVIKVNRVVQ